MKTTNPKRNLKINKTITPILTSVDTSVFNATTSSSITLSLTGTRLIAIPKSIATACRLSIGNKVIYVITIIKYNKYKKQYEKDQQTIILFDRLYRISLQDNIIEKNDYESLCNIFC